MQKTRNHFTAVILGLTLLSPCIRLEVNSP